MKNTKTYAGVGARKTPIIVLNTMIEFGSMQAKMGNKLRSGGAVGADTAFQQGHYKISKSGVTIFIPWDEFNDNFQKTDSNIHVGVCRKALILAKEFYDANKFGYRWDNLSQGAKKLQSRNVYQILGLDLETPVDYVICWTPKGQEIGGTGQAIRIATHHKIPIINLGIPQNLKHVQKIIAESK